MLFRYKRLALIIIVVLLITAFSFRSLYTRSKTRPVEQTTKYSLVQNEADSSEATTENSDIDEQTDKGDEEARGSDEIEKRSEETVKTSRQTSNEQSLKKRFTEAIAVVIVGCNRPTITRAIDSVLKYRPKEYNLPLFVSLDCNHKDTLNAVSAYEDKLTIWKNDANLQQRENNGYIKIASHYKRVFTRLFNENDFEQAIILEDDMEISSDFFYYFIATLPILKTDDSLFCVSSWNDQGRKEYVRDPTNIMRTDFFPGLGWMLHKSLWMELEPIWPTAYWDDWLRGPERRKNRGCLIPEISRTFNFGRYGVSNGQFYDEHISKIGFYDGEPVNFVRLDLSYLYKEKYDPDFLQRLASLRVIKEEQLNDELPAGEYRLIYDGNQDFFVIASSVSLMTDLRVKSDNLAGCI